MNMKRIMLTAMVALVCSTFVVAQDDDNDKKKIIGSGKVITKDVPVQGFDEISASGVFSLVLSQGGKEGVKIEADDNLQELFEVKNEGSKLVISMKKNQNFDSDNKIKVYVSFNKLKALDLKMVGGTSNDAQLNFDNLTINNKSVGSVKLNMSVKKLHIDNKSVGDIDLTGKADDVRIFNKGVGSIDASDFVVQNLDIENTGVGSAQVNVEKECKVRDSFLGKVKNKGAAGMKKTNKEKSK
jgi:hypothetical protein